MLIELANNIWVDAGKVETVSPMYKTSGGFSSESWYVLVRSTCKDWELHVNNKEEAITLVKEIVGRVNTALSPCPNTEVVK